MKIVVACDSFKNCLSSKEVAYAIKKGILNYNSSFEVCTFTTCDGGEGSVDAFVEENQGYYEYVETVNAYGNPIIAKYGVIDNGKTAVIEIANIIGLIVKEKRNVMKSSSYGVAQVLLHAKQRKVSKMIICLGGSATNDAGTGILEGLGVKFYDSKYRLLTTNSGMLRKIHWIDFSNMEDFSNIEMIVASDVKNQLLGKNGCTFCFGKQKGILPYKMELVDECMQHYAFLVEEITGKNITTIDSSGAAGGIGSALIGILNAKCQSGIELFISYTNIEEKIKNCDLVITGEGQSDFQTKFGKLPVGILNVAKKYNKPTLCISGALGKEYTELYDLGFVGIVSIADRAMNFEQALSCASEKLEACAYSQIRIIDYFRNDKKDD